MYVMHPNYDIKNILTWNRLLFGYFHFQNFNNFIKQVQTFLQVHQFVFICLFFNITHRYSFGRKKHGWGACVS